MGRSARKRSARKKRLEPVLTYVWVKPSDSCKGGWQKRASLSGLHNGSRQLPEIERLFADFMLADEKYKCFDRWTRAERPDWVLRLEREERQMLRSQPPTDDLVKNHQGNKLTPILEGKRLAIAPTLVRCRPAADLATHIPNPWDCRCEALQLRQHSVGSASLDTGRSEARIVRDSYGSRPPPSAGGRDVQGASALRVAAYRVSGLRLDTRTFRPL